MFYYSNEIGMCKDVNEHFIYTTDQSNTRKVSREGLEYKTLRL